MILKLMRIFEWVPQYVTVFSLNENVLSHKSTKNLSFFQGNKFDNKIVLMHVRIDKKRLSDFYLIYLFRRFPVNNPNLPICSVYTYIYISSSECV